MTENTFIPTAGNADISAYEEISLATQGTPEEPTDDKLKRILTRTVFVAKIVTWSGLALGLIVAGYMWSRNQSQDGILMKMQANTNDSILCQWMSHGISSGLRRDSDFRVFLREQNQTDIVDLIDSNHCVAPDTALRWLGLEQEFETNRLADVYNRIIPKKFLANTVETLPELQLIQENSPEHRTHHDEVIRIVSEVSQTASEPTAKVNCFEIRFEGLNAHLQCQVKSRPPILPRKKALDFLKALEKTESILVTYPETLDMKADEKTNVLTTDFDVSITYIPARYEPERIQKLTYEQR